MSLATKPEIATNRAGGTVAEAGSHRRLLRAGGRYARLAELQQLEEALR